MILVRENSLPEISIIQKDRETKREERYGLN